MRWQPPPGEPELRSGAIHVWRASLDVGPDVVNSMRRILSTDELERAARRPNAALQERFIAGRGLLRTLLGRYLGVEPPSLIFQYGPHGKPALESGDVCFNLSHSHGLSLFAFTRDQEIGVDLERIRPEVPYERLARRFFTAGENSAILALPATAQRPAFFRCWTRKEAYIKACGRGLSMPLSRFEVSLGELPSLIHVLGDSAEAARWGLIALDPGPDYAGTIAVEGSAGELECFDF